MHGEDRDEGEDLYKYKDKDEDEDKFDVDGYLGEQEQNSGKLAKEFTKQEGGGEGVRKADFEKNCKLKTK